jgi:hypothetical protein
MNAINKIPTVALLAALSIVLLTAGAQAATTGRHHGAAKPASRAATHANTPAQVAPTADAALVPASTEQQSAAAQVYYGNYRCDFGEKIQVSENATFPAYVDLRFGKTTYLMKPVLSPTGAIRLEDVRGQTLLLQIANKSMLMNVQTNTRLVDDCINPRQRAAAERAGQAPGLSAENDMRDPPIK